MMKKYIVIILFLIFSSLYAKQTPNLSLDRSGKVFILPSESKKSIDKILDLISNSKSNITIAMYNFSYKKFAKALVKASEKGVKIKVLLDKQKVSKNDKIYSYLRKNGIDVELIKDKMHLKLAVFDTTYALFGSSNWTKESFKKNYELLFLTQDKEVIFKLLDFTNRIK